MKTFQLSDTVRDVLARSTLTDSTLTLPEQLDRTIYQEVAKAIEGLGGKWSRKHKAHVFERDPRELARSIVDSGEGRNLKSEAQAFYTPAALASTLADLANIQPGHKVLEPSAGEGSLVKAAMKLGGLVWAFETDEHAAKKVDALLYPEGVCSREDFLTVTPEPVFDVVLMNPPFTNSQDVEHVTHAHRFLVQGGVLVAVMSAGAMFRTTNSYKAFRRLVENNGGSLDALPDDSFKESGTSVRTCVCVLPEDS